jgi:hypothetical protein
VPVPVPEARPHIVVHVVCVEITQGGAVGAVVRVNVTAQEVKMAAKAVEAHFVAGAGRWAAILRDGRAQADPALRLPPTER